MKKKLLIVDDNTNYLEQISAAFGEEFEVFQAHNGAEGLEITQREKPDLILLDVMMPQVSGVEMLRQLQGDMETRPIPVIIFSGSKLDQSTKDMIQHEINVRSFVNKPCAIAMLRGEIERVLANPR